MFITVVSSPSNGCFHPLTSNGLLVGDYYVYCDYYNYCDYYCDYYYYYYYKLSAARRNAKSNTIKIPCSIVASQMVRNLNKYLLQFVYGNFQCLIQLN